MYASWLEKCCLNGMQRFAVQQCIPGPQKLHHFLRWTSPPKLLHLKGPAVRKGLPPEAHLGSNLTQAMGGCCRVTVPAGVTSDLAGNLNTAASLTVQYRPMTTAVSAVSKSVNGVVGGAVAVSVATSLVAGKAACCNPAIRRQKLS